VKIWQSLAGALAVALLFAATFVWWFWQPLRVLERTQDHLQKQVERRNWEAVGELLAENYSDVWGHNKENALEAGAEVLRHFFLLRLRPEDGLEISPGVTNTTVLKRRLAVEGSGSAIATMIIQRVNDKPGRFLFTWERQTGWPPTWLLRNLSHEDPGRF